MTLQLASPLRRDDIFRADQPLPRGREQLEKGRALAHDWSVGDCAFLRENGVVSEVEYKRRQIAAGRIMQHAHLGLRDSGTSVRAWREIFERCQQRGVTIDRYGVCLDWSMGYPRAGRERYPRGTGVVLPSPESFAALTSAAPAAPHFGDFVLGFPAALENTAAALAAGSTSIGNLGQYFTFRLRYWDDDVGDTCATLQALGLIAGQDVEVLVHSNLDDGFAAQFTDVSCMLGAAMIEQYVVQELCGCRLSHCYGHHFSEPLTRWAFQRALRAISNHPGTMIYGDTVSYLGGASENFASLGSYFLVDVLAQLDDPSGHALIPVPVTENERVPDADEIVDAQLFAARLIELAPGYRPLLDNSAVDELAGKLLTNASTFQGNVMKGFADAGIDTSDALEMLLTLRRVGARRLEMLYGPGETDEASAAGRTPRVAASTILRLQRRARHALANADQRDVAAAAGRRVLIAATDVHEHGKWLVEEVLRGAGAVPLDGGVSVDAETLADLAVRLQPDVIAVSTYNGMALDYWQRLRSALAARSLHLPVVLGGRLNQIPEHSNTSLPVDVGDALLDQGGLVCRDIEELLAVLATPRAGVSNASSR